MIELPINYNGHSIDPAWNTYVKLILPQDELPLPNNIQNLYLDFETTSGDLRVDSLNPHKADNCKILGVAVLFDAEVQPYYVPVRHYYLDEKGERQTRTDIPNYSEEKVLDWLRKLLSLAQNWINQNVKYDVHVAWYNGKIRPRCKLIDTLSLAKLSMLEEQLNYSLDRVMRLLGIDITPYEKKIKQFIPKGVRDYGIVPPDHMAVYAGVDVLAGRYVHKNIKIHQECARVVRMENELLPELIRMEQIGTRTDVHRLIKDYEEIPVRQQERLRKIKEIAQYPDFLPGKQASLEELFCNKLGLHVDFTPTSIENYEKSGNEDVLAHSFSYENLLKHRDLYPELLDLWLGNEKLGIVGYTEEEKLLTSYTMPYLFQHNSKCDVIHPNFNQIVHTGRMSCRNPNMQQLNKAAKEYIIPYTEDYVLVEFDLSQIEFRVIVHYIDNKSCLEAYRTNPETDFHVWIAAMCGIDRYPAKRINFMLGYGGGKGKTVALLSTLLQSEAKERALYVYNKYHATLPELKPNTYRASQVINSRGYVKTLFGRHRHIPRQFCFKAFNSVCQGSAADIQKQKTLDLRPFFGIDCILHLLVHDCWLFSIRKERLNELIPQIAQVIERPIEGIDFNVPLRVDFKKSEKNWASCT